MKAVGFATAGSIDRDDALVDIACADPVPGPRDLLVRVKAISVNPVDTKIRANAQPPAGDVRILGFDAAGVVEAVGDAVTLFRPGDPVFYAGDVNRPGSYAELQAVDERIVGRKPGTIDWAEAAALPLTAITAWEVLFDRLGIARRHDGACGTLLILNSAGGVGSVMVQLAARLTACTVVATASRPETRAWVESLGAHHVVDHGKALDEELRRIGIGQVDYIACLTDKDDQIAQLSTIIAPQGRIAMVTASKALDIAGFMRKSVTIAWELMFTRSSFATTDMIEQHVLLNEVARLVDGGVLRSTATRTLSPINAANLRAAHREVESGRTIGKIVLAGF